MQHQAKAPLLTARDYNAPHALADSCAVAAACASSGSHHQAARPESTTGLAGPCPIKAAIPNSLLLLLVPPLLLN
jgi:hypothetical protein